MPTYTVFAGVSDGRVISNGQTSWLATRAGNGLSASTGDTTFTVGLDSLDTKGGRSWDAYEYFVEFDTSVITASDVVTAVALSLFGTGSFLFTGQSTWTNIEAYQDDWGGTVTTADWIAGASIGALTKVATFTKAGWSTSAYNTFTENGTSFRSAINKAGFSRLLVCIDALRDITDPGPGPSGNYQHYFTFFAADQTGTTNDPKIVVTTTASDTSKMLALF